MSVRRRDFILGSLAMPVLAGCGTIGLFGRRPALAFGVISDIHVTTPESTEKFRRALRYFRSRGADAIIVAGDALRIRSVNGDRRNGTWAIFYELRFPTAKAGGRVFDYEARVEREDGTSVGSKTFLSPAFHRLPSDEPSEQRFLYDAMDLPETGRYRFAVYPRNCFGAKGKPLFSRFFETKPGKNQR